MLPSSENQFQRDKVKQRLLKTAAELWDYSETEMEGLDPLVDLLFGACAVQFEKTARELQHSKTRVLKQLASLLLPEALVVPAPAHAIMHARPVEPTHLLTPNDQFLTPLEIINPEHLTKPDIKQVYFSSAHLTPLVNGDVQYLAFDQKLVQLTNQLHREPVLRSSDSSRCLPAQSLWIGVSFAANVSRLDELTFYVDWKNQPDVSYYRTLLSSAQWYAQGQPLNARSGYASTEPGRPSPGQDWRDELPNVSDALEKQTRQAYQNSFVTVQNIDPQSQLQPYPEAFRAVFEGSDLDQLSTPLWWVEVRFPRLMPPEVLSNTVCAINCFPVLNRKLQNSNRPYRVSKLLNIIPLATEDHFLAMHRVNNDQGTAYRNLPFQRYKTMGPNTYAVRQDGVARFDRRNATEFANYLLDLIRDENVAFEAMGGSRVVQDIKSIRQCISRLERQISANASSQDVRHYLALNAEKDENIWVEFWSTLGTTANKIAAGTKLQPVNSADFQNDHLQLLTSTYGGRDKPSDAEKVHTFRSALLSRDRLVTEEDIRAACYVRLGELIASVSFRKGVRILPQANQALERTLDVIVQLVPTAGMSEEESESAQRDLGQYITQRASTVLPIQVIINN